MRLEKLWQKLEPLLPKMKKCRGRVGRPATKYREIMDAIFWMLKTGAQWRALPKNYRPKSTLHGRFQTLVQQGFNAWRKNSRRNFKQQVSLIWKRHFLMGPLRLQKRGPEIRETKRSKGAKIMILADGHGLPLGVLVESANRSEVRLAERTLSERFIRSLPRRIVADMAYDSDALDERLRERGIDLIAPNRPNRKNLTQDKSKLPRYKRRWLVERLNA